MAKERPVLKAEIREQSGKGASRALRREGKVPAIIYGNKKEEISITTDRKELQKEYLRGNFTSRIYDLEVGKDKISVLPRDVQLHPVSDVAIHADFQRVENDTKVHVLIPVHFLNRDKSIGLKRGGVLSIIRREIELICRADSIPEYLEIDLDGLKIGESLHSHSIKYPEGTHPAITDRDFTIAAIVGKTSQEELEEAAPVEDADAEGGDEESSDNSDE
ncbi:MAG: 50S ribosomal protein L25/general stress protein Ctc [Rickettsiales bacterium]|nr:50S ribosomal protein L25/general stress protein Ctc [Pseudomonadota bacterium]MDA0966416.1 50S ribosomal protein L25/general stress protein Ctc [Pseudomonadota bacterium]MDG4543278.1 50S ribosomal protein L25/general stress protein Ctc [Rickettsiales bacterium]MDG4545544.1 50S ribosomal protein L25/general stress protein Ctc [Rickettsiales bacterium]MDG4547993.1 50S ribosomal protein L25/general stress protein Ctc [Rickettsiales bacterium]